MKFLDSERSEKGSGFTIMFVFRFFDKRVKKLPKTIQKSFYLCRNSEKILEI